MPGRSLATNLVAIIAAWASGLILVLTLRDDSAGLAGWQWFLAALAILGAAYACLAEVRDWKASRRRTRVMPLGPKVDEYMKEWIAGAGRVAIFSRDLSWVKKNTEIRKLLCSKAKDGELVLVLPAPIKISTELERQGAVAHYYGTTHAIASRFTIVNVDRADSAVAIGFTKEGQHKIQEFREDNGDPAFFLARDLLNLVRTISGPTK